MKFERAVFNKPNDGASSAPPPERQREIAKQAEAWYEILSSGELIGLHVDVRDELRKNISSNEKSIVADYDSYTKERVVVAQEVDDEASFSHEGLATRENNIHIAYFNQTMKSYCQLRCMSYSDELKEPDLSFFKTSCFFYDKTKEILTVLEKKTGDLPDAQKKLYRDWTQLRSPSKIVLDNIQTYFDVFRFITKDCASAEEQKDVIRRLVTERPGYMHKGSNGQEIDLNPQRETNLELLARAPFAFWGGTVRNSTPTSIYGKPVVNPGNVNEPLFSSDFIYLVTREHVRVHDPKEGTVENLVRHGGCPIMHRDFKRSDLVTSLGALFLDYYELLS